jgi:hypothetical protein
MPCSPGSRTFLLASLAPRIDDAVRPVGLATTSAKGLTVATTARTTRFCRTRVRLFAACPPSAVDVAGRMLARRTLSAARPHAVSGSQGLPALPAPRVHDAAASTATRFAYRNDVRSPLKVEPGWPTHTTNPNFGKVEYFRKRGLTSGRNRAAICQWDVALEHRTQAAVSSSICIGDHSSMRQP